MPRFSWGVGNAPDALHVRDGKLRTAAGVTAGMDLALALVEEDLGREIAMRVAAQLVMFFKRPGGQLQFSRKGDAQPAGRSALQDVQRWVAANPALPLTVDDFADHAGLSPATSPARSMPKWACPLRSTGSVMGNGEPMIWLP